MPSTLFIAPLLVLVFAFDQLGAASFSGYFARGAAIGAACVLLFSLVRRLSRKRAGD